MGDVTARSQTLAELVTTYPWHDRALESLSQAAVSAGERGVALYNHDEDDAARQEFEASLDAGESVAQAHYYLALLAERAGDPDAALDHYDAALAALAGRERLSLYGETAWERALLLETLGRTDEAVWSATAGPCPTTPSTTGATTSPRPRTRTCRAPATGWPAPTSPPATPPAQTST
jgi:hypothetical protein